MTLQRARRAGRTVASFIVALDGSKAAQCQYETLKMLASFIPSAHKLDCDIASSKTEELEMDYTTIAERMTVFQKHLVTLS